MGTVSDDQIFNNWIIDLKGCSRTHATILNYKSSVKNFRQFLDKKGHTFLDVDGLQGQDILFEYHEYLKTKPNGNGKPIGYKTISKYFNALSSLYDYLFYKRMVKDNLIPAFEKRYLSRYKNGYQKAERKFITVSDMSRFLKSILDLQDKTICLLLVTTGLRREELRYVDINDVDLEKRIIHVKVDHFKKRMYSGGKVPFSNEAKIYLEMWMKTRENLASPGNNSLFIGSYGRRATKNRMYEAVNKWARIFGLHDASSNNLSDHFGPHNLRHCWTTYLEEAKMFEPYVMYLRGDSPGKAIDLYKHFSIEKIMTEYDRCIPTFGI